MDRMAMSYFDKSECRASMPTIRLGIGPNAARLARSRPRGTVSRLEQSSVALRHGRGPASAPMRHKYLLEKDKETFQRAWQGRHAACLAKAGKKGCRRSTLQ
jgi:hypothetical protein